MTNHWLDLQHAKVFLIEGSNCAENHPMAMKWIMRAKEKGAIVNHVDPIFTRTIKIADIHSQIRPVTDNAFLISIINYILENKLYDEQFLIDHTNALMYSNEKFSFENGLFSGYQEGEFKYDMATWGYDLDEDGNPKKATSFDAKGTVFARMKEFFAPFTFEKASSISGIPVEKIKLIADTYTQNAPGTILYALGMTQHTVGVQNIRSFGVLQLLTGNVVKLGTGVNALRGEPDVQGATAMASLFHYAPGYLNWPNHDIQDIGTWTKGSGTFRRTFLVSLMKAWFGDNATPENDFGFKYLPKKNGAANYSIFRIFETAVEDKMKMLYIM